jgi:DNA-binding LytR/AlgR family response regulator
MGQAGPFKPIAVVVEDDMLQREDVAALLEESEMGVVQCDTAEEALRVLEKMGERVSLMFTDITLSGRIDGVELAHFSAQRYANIYVIVTSGRALMRRLPEGVKFMPKPWVPLDILREVGRSLH